MHGPPTLTREQVATTRILTATIAMVAITAAAATVDQLSQTWQPAAS